MRVTSGRAPAGLAVLAAVVAGACGTTESVEASAADELEAELGMPAEVTCPEGAEATRGEEFDCIATVDGKQITVHLEFTDDKSVAITVVGLAAKVADVNGLVAIHLEADLDLVPDDVDCGETVVIASPVEPFECDVVLAGEAGVVAVTVDETGAITDIAPQG